MHYPLWKILIEEIAQDIFFNSKVLKKIPVGSTGLPLQRKKSNEGTNSDGRF